ncbi:trafficking kinesin-binding protein 1-like isoform X1 [Varroa destructor]|uniref:HAP1 N-terminal domain-containing protein n=1 Tax=Varroa destructor TaxID=109461 RepID=A0A7M7L6X8_VARDE|nr:trafficking kinesin-binding protein 1-like isoform X1 [Varroa destructor]XP_022671855.1 trafficking kinesin-binding protein 1-like isoform X1 [Varroa destructor]XP_022671856.1 trafficking kinesin-binding protein 1-like isoform X1 [Varroa destructor]XP_022671857.1 trafficking kinesin-binding protein 1-like isoform X1 [Varroa destructor]XP_022671858.1 trafficking kinesin-binding protein 1-like isoform X1 [Varroa destructor]XP_022671859.1 trafficking kinesin-binding protein 1-like isoform X1 [
MFETEKVFTNVNESNQEKVIDEGYHSPYRASFGRVLGTGRLRGHDIPDSDEERGNHFELLCTELLGDMSLLDNRIPLARLLINKAQDIELAIRIGKTLLEEKTKLQDTIDCLNDSMKKAEDETARLRHGLSVANGLLAVHENGQEDDVLPEDSPTYHVDRLKKKIGKLEAEIARLKHESGTWTQHLATNEVLLTKRALELNASQQDKNRLLRELSKKSMMSSKQNEEITRLRKQICVLQEKICAQSVENKTLQISVDEINEARQALTSELANSERKYSELLHAFRALQEDLRQKHHYSDIESDCDIVERHDTEYELDKNDAFEVNYRVVESPGQIGHNSLAAELSTLTMDNSTEPDSSFGQQRISGADSLPHLFRNGDDVSKWPVDSDEPEVMSDVSSAGASTDRKKHKSKRIETQIVLQSRGKKGNALCEGCLVRKNAQQISRLLCLVFACLFIAQTFRRLIMDLLN